MKFAVLTSEHQWLQAYAVEFVKSWPDAELFFDHNEIHPSYEVVFIVGYHSVIEKEWLNTRAYNLVVHESNLPQGRGWAPMFWQVLEGKHEIVFSLFEAINGIDSGPVYIKEKLVLNGTELYSELRKKQAMLTFALCEKFLQLYPTKPTPTPQVGNPTYYRRRTQEDNLLNIDQPLRTQINLLRVSSNDEFPAFFFYRGKKFIVKVEEEQ